MIQRLAIVLWWVGVLALGCAAWAFVEDWHAARVCSESRQVLGAAEPEIAKMADAKPSPDLDALLAARAASATLQEFDQLAAQAVAMESYSASHPEYGVARAAGASCSISTLFLAIVFAPSGALALVACFVLSGSFLRPPRQSQRDAKSATP